MLMSVKKAWLKPSSGKAIARSIFLEEVIHTQDNFVISKPFLVAKISAVVTFAESVQLKNRMRFKGEKINVEERTNKTQNITLFKVKLQF